MILLLNCKKITEKPVQVSWKMYNDYCNEFFRIFKGGYSFEE